MTDIFASYLERYRNSRQLKATSWYTVGSFAEKGIAFLFTFIFARLLTTEEFGTVSIFQTWVVLLTPIVTLNIYSSVQRAKFDIDEESYNDYISSIITLGTMTAALALLVVVILPDSWLESIFGLSTPLILLAFSLPIFILSVQTFIQKWKVLYQYRTATFVSFFKIISQLAASTLLIILLTLWTVGVASTGRILGIVIIEAIFGTVLFIKAQREGKERFNRSFWKYGLAFSIPLILHTISAIAIAQFDRILIGRYLGASDAGLYSFAYQLSDPIRYLWLATNAAWIPWFFEQMKAEKIDAINTRSREYIYAFTFITASAIVILPVLFSILSPPAYKGSLKIMPLVMASGYITFLYSFFVNVEFFEKKTFLISTATIFAAGLNILLNLLFLSRYGIMVAAWATLISYFFLFVFHLGVVRLILKRKELFSLKLILLMMGLIVALSVTVTYLI